MRTIVSRGELSRDGARWEPDLQLTYGRRPHLLSMWVAPPSRRNGIGAQLVDVVVDWATATGFRRLLLDVGELNNRAVGLYSSKGFVRTGRASTFPPPREHVRELEMALERLS